MSRSLPPRPNLEWLKKLSKDRLAAMRQADPAAKLSAAQHAVATEFGFASWRKLKAHVEQLAGKPATSAPIAPDDADLARLLSAAREGDAKTVQAILARRPELANARGPDGATPLHAGVESNSPAVAEAILAAGGDPDARYGDSGHTVLSWAVTYHSDDFARTLIRRGAKPDLFCAAGLGELDHVRAAFDAAGRLIPNASLTGSSRLAADGMRLPCPPASATEQISDALYIASRNAHVEVVRFLLQHAPDLSFNAYMGGTPLHWAYFGGSRAVIDLLLKAGADPNNRENSLHCTPRAFGICAPANWGFGELVVRRLMEDPTLATLQDGWTTPLHEAARSGNASIVQLLLAAGADAALRDGNGKTPLDIATEKAHSDVVRLLESVRAGS